MTWGHWIISFCQGATFALAISNGPTWTGLAWLAVFAGASLLNVWWTAHMRHVES